MILQLWNILCHMIVSDMPLLYLDQFKHTKGGGTVRLESSFALRSRNKQIRKV